MDSIWLLIIVFGSIALVFYAYAKYFSDNLATALYNSVNATEASIQVGGFIKSMLKKIKNKKK